MKIYLNKILSSEKKSATIVYEIKNNCCWSEYLQIRTFIWKLLLKKIFFIYFFVPRYVFRSHINLLESTFLWQNTKYLKTRRINLKSDRIFEIGTKNYIINSFFPEALILKKKYHRKTALCMQESVSAWFICAVLL